MPRLLASLFVLIALPTCLMLAVLVPPGQVADEPGHIARADALRHGVLHGTRRDIADPAGGTLRRSGIGADANLFRVSLVLRPGSSDKLDAERLAASRALPWSGSRPFVEIGTIATYMPIFYLPSAIGLAIAQRAGLGPYDAIVFARIGSALCFVGLGAAAIGLARRGRALMFCALCCPMTLSLGASFNQDGLLIASAALAASLATRGGAGPRRGAAVLIGCIAAVKLPYLPLAALLLVPGLASGEGLGRRALRVAVVALPALVWTGVMLATVSAPTPRSPYPAGPLWPGDPAAIFTGTDPLAQLRVLLADPVRFVWLPLRTLLHDPWLIPQGIGVLGWLNVLLPTALYVVWAVAIVLAFGADLLAARDQAARWRETVMLAAAAGLAVWAIYLSQYLLWTDVGLERVEGPTGRYFLPLVPLVGLALPSLPLPRWPMLLRAATAGPVLAGLCGLIALPAVMVGTYYLR
jgi:hypothetical protein